MQVALDLLGDSDRSVPAVLFGHVRGAFTGVDRDRAGIFEAARGGALLLNEVGDLPASAQGKFLRVLQEGEIRRVGESFSRKVDVRVVAATDRNLEQMVRDGEFRQDLFFKVATVELPPPLKTPSGTIFCHRVRGRRGRFFDDAAC